MTKKSRVPPIFKKAVSYFFTKPATTMYPYVKPQLPDNFRGKPVFDIQLCIGCGLCNKECPSKAIEMVEIEKGKRRPQFRLDKCIFCYQCAETCPRKAIENSTFYELATMDKSSLIMKP
ncbi:MAG: 4Fe-4S binding protein [Candidatus Bathyarchaeota archaeon]|nr:4Fe-4S binding protein [Candidatus Bathyarchaeota archaeon]